MAQQLILSIEDTSVLNTVRRMLQLVNGVTIVRTPKSKNIDKEAEYEPNNCTKRAMQDARSGKVHKASSADDLINQILG